MIKKTLTLAICYYVMLAGTAGHCNPVVSPFTTEVVGDFEGSTAIAVDGAYAYVCNLVAASISVVDTQRNTVVATIKDPTMTAPFKLSVINGYAYVCNLNRNTISIIDTTHNTFVKTFSHEVKASNNVTTASVLGTPLAFIIDVGIMHILDIASPINPKILQTFYDPHINGLAISVGAEPDYSVYVTAVCNGDQGQVLAYSQMGGIYSSTPRAMVPPAAEDGQLLTAITTVGRSYAYVCDQLNDVVQVYDLQRCCYLTSVEGLNSPIALTTSGSYVYVCNFGAAPPSPQRSKKILEAVHHPKAISVIEVGRHTIRGSLAGFNSPQAITLIPGYADAFYVIGAPIISVADTGFVDTTIQQVSPADTGSIRTTIQRVSPADTGSIRTTIQRAGPFFEQHAPFQKVDSGGGFF